MLNRGKLRSKQNKRLARIASQGGVAGCVLLAGGGTAVFPVVTGGGGCGAGTGLAAAT